MTPLIANEIPTAGAVASLFVTTVFLAHAPKEPPRTDESAKRTDASPRKAETIFPWARLGIFEELSFEPTPGPGDSEGGDVFSPLPPVQATA